MLCCIHFCMNNFINYLWKSEIWGDLLTRHFFNLKVVYLQRSHLWSWSLFSPSLCHLNSSPIFLFFGARPSDFKSSFKLRKDHFSTTRFSEKLPSPMESHKSGREVITSQNFRASQKASMNISVGESYLPQAWRCTVLEKVAPLCTCIICKNERATGTEASSPKLSARETNDKD